MIVVISFGYVFSMILFVKCYEDQVMIFLMIFFVVLLVVGLLGMLVVVIKKKYCNVWCIYNWSGWFGYVLLICGGMFYLVFLYCLYFCCIFVWCNVKIMFKFLVKLWCVFIVDLYCCDVGFYIVVNYYYLCFM